MNEEQAVKEMGRGKHIMTVNKNLARDLINRFNGKALENLDEFHRPSMENLITQIEPAPPWYIQKYQEYEKNEAKKFVNFDRDQARQKRMEALRKHSKEIGVDIPIDPRFIDWGPAAEEPDYDSEGMIPHN